MRSKDCWAVQQSFASRSLQARAQKTQGRGGAYSGWPLLRLRLTTIEISLATARPHIPINQMTTRTQPGSVHLLGLLLLTLLGISSFLYGFLPLKPFIQGFTPAPESATPPAFDRLVFMLVDGLRR